MASLRRESARLDAARVRAVADRALRYGTGGGIRQRHLGPGVGDDDGTPIPLGRADLAALDAALKICEAIGEAEFLELSGDFEMVLCRPPSDQRPLSMYLRKGSLGLPVGREQDGGIAEHPLAGFREAMATDTRAQTYLAAARHAVAAAKEAAVSEFRAAAEDQIMAFDRALGGRPLDGFRMDSALSLIARLKAGLGGELRGLSEHARITALEWSAAADSAGRTEVARQEAARAEIGWMAAPVAAVPGIG